MLLSAIAGTILVCGAWWYEYRLQRLEKSNDALREWAEKMAKAWNAECEKESP